MLRTHLGSKLFLLRALDQLISVRSPGTKVLFGIFIFILTQMHSGVFQRPLDMYYSADSMQKMVLESSHLLLGFQNMYTLPFFSSKLFLETIFIFIKILYVNT